MDWITLDDLASRYDGLLFDAYGVLVHGGGAIDGAREAIARLRERGLSYWVVTNDASRTPAEIAARFVRLGFELERDQVVSSGSLLVDVFARRGLDGAPTLVLGPQGSRDCAEHAGADLLALRPGVEPAVVVLGDESGFDLLEGLEIALNAIVRGYDRGRPPVLLCPNPDVLYPKGDGTLGVAVASLASLLEAALEARLPDVRPRFERLGKPFAMIYEQALARTPSRNVAMIGDQLATDVRGALEVGLDAALVATGVFELEVGRDYRDDPRFALIRPTHLLEPFGRALS